MPLRRNRRTYDYRRTVSAIMQTPQSSERNMYASIRDIFIYTLGFEQNNIIVDTGISNRGVPDLVVNTELARQWIVVEVKDERGIFGNQVKRQAIFTSKHRYVGIDTEYFVFIDPEYIVVRPIIPAKLPASYNSEADRVFKWTELAEEQQFLSNFGFLSHDEASEGRRLQRFRQGDESLIATISVTTDHGKTLFLSSLKRMVANLNEGFNHALIELKEDITTALKSILQFESNFQGSKISTSPINITKDGMSVSNKSEFVKDAHRIKTLCRKNNLAFTIANEYIKPYFSDTNEVSTEAISKVIKRLLSETINLTVARILLLRFFEDHNFFGDKKYLCNGGVKAFQEMRNYFIRKYPILLKIAYDEASKLYEAVFGETALDWILHSNNDRLSQAIERAMFYASLFDFRTIKEDVLSGVYREIIPPKDRKALGQFYTPPIIARYIVNAIGINHESKVIDPACGLGTFLVEAFHKMLGEKIRQGIYNYDDVLEKIENIKGNDLNAFVSVISQIQILWNLLEFKEDIKTEGFPLIAISGGYDSIAVGGRIYSYGDEWDDIDSDKFDAVIGNPPYVRAERQTISYGRKEEVFYSDVSFRSNIFCLFIFKAMQYWLKEGGKLGFIIPLSFCDNDDNHNLRNLFKIDKRWKICEIVDLEEVSDIVFPDCTVNPIILIAQKTPATASDMVVLKKINKECLQLDNSGNIIGLNIDNAIINTMPYEDIWTKDGRLLTRINYQRKNLLDKIDSVLTARFGDIAMKYWVGLRGNTIVKHSSSPPQGNDGLRWEERKMLCRGTVFRREKHIAINNEGMDIYKGENISPCMIEGEPVERNIDVKKMSSPELWRYDDLLPERAFAFAGIALVPYAAEFNPKDMCILDTASLFIPQEDYKDFPFDFLVLSSIYQWYFAVSLREGVVSEYWAHIYPSVVARIPWVNTLLDSQNELIELKKDWLLACRKKARATEVLFESFSEIQTETVLQKFERNSTLKIRWSGRDIEEGDDTTWYCIQTGMGLFDFFDINDSSIASQLEEVLPAFKDSLTLETLRDIPLPTEDSIEQWHQIIAEWKAYNAEDKIKEYLDELDKIVARAFGLTDDELAFVKNEMKEDGLFSQLKYRLPFTNRKLRGLLLGLSNSERYRS